MKSIQQTGQFKRDVKLSKKRGKDLDKLKAIILLLADEQELDVRHHDHVLVGNWSDSRECHIEPDWLLIYRQTEEYLVLERTGSHSDLFR